MPDDVHKHTVSYQLRETIEARGLSAREVARLADVDHRLVSRFLRRERELAGPTIDRVCLALGLRLVEVAARARGRGRRPSPAAGAGVTKAGEGTSDGLQDHE